MNDNNIRLFRRTSRVETYCIDRKAEIPPGSVIAKQQAALSLLIKGFNEDLVGQLRTPVGKQTLLDALKLDFKDIARTARAIRLDDPDFPAADYRRPSSLNEFPLTTHADSLLTRLEDQETDTPEQKAAKAALRQRFIDYLLPTDFVADLRQDRDALSQKNSDKHSDNQESVASTADIENALTKAGEIVQRLDAAFQNKYRDDPASLAA